MMLSSVDLPAPDGPVIDSHSPRSSDRSTSTSAWTAGSVPYCLPTFFSSSTRVVVPRSARCRILGSRLSGVLVSDHHELARR